PTAHRSPLTAHRSPLTAHRSPLTAHRLTASPPHRLTPSPPHRPPPHPAMYPPTTLPDSRHEAFALALAQGMPPTAAYIHAGHTGNNAKARGAALAKDPDIAQRADYLRACLPRIRDLQARFAPSTLFIPQTKDQLQAWLWQVATGARQVTALQFRAAALLARLKGWHLASHTSNTAKPKRPHRSADPEGMPPPPDDPQPNPTPDPGSQPDLITTLGPEERAHLADFIQQTITADTASALMPPELEAAFLSRMADAFLVTLYRTIPAEALEGPDHAALFTNLLAAIQTHLHRSPPPQASQASHPATPDAAPSDPNSPIPAKSPPQTPDPERFNKNFPHLDIDLSKPRPWAH
ncbi:MAG TPA: hypothetical protein VD994_11635, partial [Prosthecobacter sp.]|nr:hypothetical protein [Prosthecobacter sp.]